MKASRNEPCPCGSGQKYKKCCFLTDAAAEAVVVTEAQATQAAEKAAETSKRAENPGGRTNDRQQSLPRGDQSRVPRASSGKRRRAV